MKVDELARLLTDSSRPGLSPELAQKLGLASEDATRGRLMALSELDRAFFGVYLLGAYVVNDTDFWGDGEIYWWSIPALADSTGTIIKSPLHGLPNAMAPHKVGSLEWMTNLSPKEPPLLAVIPPEERHHACVLRLAFYDDDGKPADMLAAMRAGLEAWAAVSPGPLPGADQLIGPVREAIFKGLNAKEDDILIDQDLTIRRGASIPFGNGMIGSVMNSMIRLFYLVKDEDRTETFGPVMLHKGQVETVKFQTPLRGGGRLALFARGAEVKCSAFGELSTDTPFVNRVIDRGHEAGLVEGFQVTGTGPAKFIAYYTPPA